MAGEHPAASNVLAIMSMLTKFVMHCTSGLCRRTACTDIDEVENGKVGGEEWEGGC